LVLRKCLQVYAGPKTVTEARERLSVLAFLQPDKQDHIAPRIRNSAAPGWSRSHDWDALASSALQRYDLTLLNRMQTFRRLLSTWSRV